MTESERPSTNTPSSEGDPPPPGRVVVGVDGSEGSLAALRFALAEARLRGAGVVAVLAFTRPSTEPAQVASPYPPAVMLPSGYNPDADEEAAVRNELDRAVEKVLAAGAYDAVTVTTETVEGHPAQVLLDLARPDDLVVVGSRGYGRFAGTLLGSVSQHVVTHARCPVVVVPHGR